MRASPSKRDRDGSVVVVVLVCLMALAMIGAASLRVALDERRVIRADEGRLQAEWLMRSGLERAVFRLAEEDAYEGETWEIPADAVGGQGDRGRADRRGGGRHRPGPPPGERPG